MTIAPYCAEFVGTALLVLAVGANAPIRNPSFGPIAVAVILSVLCYCTSSLSGGYLNPAITIAATISKQLPKREAAIYCGAQMAGGLCGAWICSFLFWDTFTLGPCRGFSWISMGLAEICYTFMLSFTVLNCGVKSYNDPSGSSCPSWLVVGLTVAAGGYGAGYVSGGLFNPAIAFGLDSTNIGSGFGWCFAYIGFQFIGAAIASGLLRDVRPEWHGRDLGMREFVEGWAEFTGTFMLTFTVSLCLLGPSRLAPVSAGACLAAMAMAVGDVSGGMFNPVVTMALILGKLCRPGRSLCVFTQFFAASLATFMAMQMHGWKRKHVADIVDDNHLQRFAAEVIFTAIFCLTILTTERMKRESQSGEPEALAKRRQLELVGPLACGLALAGGAATAGLVGAGALNPVVAISVSVIADQASVAGGVSEATLSWLLLSFGEFVGALIAGVLAHLPPKPKASTAIPVTVERVPVPASYGAFAANPQIETTPRAVA